MAGLWAEQTKKPLPGISPTSLLAIVNNPLSVKGRMGKNDLFHSDMTVLPHRVISLSYNKLVHGLDLQVSIMGGLAEVQIWTNQTDGAQYTVGVPWFLKHNDACRVAGEELHLIRHLGAGGEEAYPRDEAKHVRPRRLGPHADKALYDQTPC